MVYLIETCIKTEEYADSSLALPKREHLFTENTLVGEDEAVFVLPLISGPKFWKTKYPNCDGERRFSHQSPININSSNLVKPSYGNKIIKNNYDTPPTDASKEYELLNNGHTLMFKLPKNNQYRIRKGECLYVYNGYLITSHSLVS